MNSQAEALKVKLAYLTNATEHSLNVIALWMVHYRKHSTDLTHVWFESFLCFNMDIKCKLVTIMDKVLVADKHQMYMQQFRPLLKDVLNHFLRAGTEPKFKNSVSSILENWTARGFLDAKTIDFCIQFLKKNINIACYENELSTIHSQLDYVQGEQSKFLNNKLYLHRLTSYEVENLAKLEAAALLDELDHAIMLQTQSNEFVSREIELKKKEDELITIVENYQSIGFCISDHTALILAEKVKSAKGATVAQIEELQIKVQNCHKELSVVHNQIAQIEEKKFRLMKQTNQYLDLYNVISDPEVVVDRSEASSLMPACKKISQSDQERNSKKRKCYQREI